jgi:diguanylate cyclase (GGDEF)-like protein/PAS domain S-box-containing protein
LYFQYKDRVKGIDYWIGFHLMMFFGFLASVSRLYIPVPIAVLITNSLNTGSMIVLLMGLTRFMGKPIKVKPLWIVYGLYLCGFIYFTLVDDQLGGRRIFLYSFSVISNAMIAWYLLKNSSKQLGKTLVFASVIHFFITMGGAVALGLSISSTASNDYLANNIQDVLAIIFVIIGSIFLTYAQVMLISARLLDNVLVSERKFSLVFDNTQLPVFITRLSDGKIYDLNQSFESLFGYEKKELLGKTTLELGLWEDPDQRQYLINQTNGNESVKGVEAVFVTKAGNKLICQISCNMTRIQGEDYILNDIVDVTDSVKLREDLKRLATQDHLTNLANRALFYDRFEQAKAQAQRHDNQLSIIIMDMDKLKDVNDNYGHLVGDKALVYLADQISSVLRKTDTFARFGGDEFCIILNEMKNIEGTLFVLRKIQEVLSVPMTLDNHELKVQVSMGIALYPQDGASINELIKKADRAMYTVKADRGPGYRFYQEVEN